MKTKDPQGTILVETKLGRAIAKKVLSTDFFFSTEFMYLAEQQGITVLELPVKSGPELRPSKVRLIRDGSRLALQTIRLAYRRRRRIRE